MNTPIAIAVLFLFLIVNLAFSILAPDTSEIGSKTSASKSLTFFNFTYLTYQDRNIDDIKTEKDKLIARIGELEESLAAYKKYLKEFDKGA